MVHGIGSIAKLAPSMKQSKSVTLMNPKKSNRKKVGEQW